MTHRVIAMLALAALLAGCGRTLPRITIGRRAETTPFVPAKVEQLASEIEMTVQRASRLSDEQAAEQVGTELEFGEEQVDPEVLLGAMEELEDDVPSLRELHVDTPEVVTAIRARQLRAPSVAEWKDRGCLGETEFGKLTYVTCQACEQDDVLAERLAFIIIKENRSRRVVFEALRDRNGWSTDRDRDIQHAFGAAHRELAAPTHYVEVDGQFVRQMEPAEMRANADDIPTIGRRSQNDQDWDQADIYEDEWATIPPRAIPPH